MCNNGSKIVGVKLARARSSGRQLSANNGRRVKSNVTCEKRNVGNGVCGETNGRTNWKDRKIQYKKKNKKIKSVLPRAKKYSITVISSRARYNLLAKSGRRGAREITSAFGVELHAHAHTGVYIMYTRIVCGVGSRDGKKCEKKNRLLNSVARPPPP